MEYEDFSCPFLRLKANPQASATYPTADHFCSRTRPVSSPSVGYQRTFCLKAFHTTCPVFTKQRGVMPVGFRGPGLRTTSPKVLNTLTLWLILLFFGVAIFGLWGYKIISAAGLGFGPALSDLSFRVDYTPSPTRTILSNGTLTPSETFLGTVLRTRTPTGTPRGGLTPTRTQTKPLTPTPFFIPTITPTNNPGKLSQTINFLPLAAKTYGNSSFPLSASASPSGLTVNFSTLSVSCSIIVNTLTIHAAGSCTVTASQGGNATYNPAPPVSRTFNIAKADPGCTITPYFHVPYDTLEYEATGSCAGVLAEGPLSGLDLSGTRNTSAGTYPADTWTFTDGTGNYLNKNGTVTDIIDKGSQTITFNPPPNKTYGDLDFTLSASASVMPVNFNLVSGPCSINVNTLTINGAGSCTVTASQFGDQNWQAATPITKTINIAKASPSCTFTPYSVSYDGSPHSASGSCLGVNGDNPSGLNFGSSTHTNAGSYNDAWTFTDTSGNYNNDSGTVADSISKALASCLVTGYSVTYDGTAQTATGTCTGVIIGDLSGSLVLGGTIHTYAGTYNNDPWSFSDPNYTNPGGSVSDNIAKADAPTCSVTGYNDAYTGNLQTASGSCGGVSGLDLSGTGHTNVGSWTDSWTFSNSNYFGTSGSVTDSITSVDPTCSVTGYNVADDGADHTATGSCTGTKGETLSGLDLSGTTHNGPVDQDDTWSFTDGTGNYNSTSGTVHDTIYTPPPPTPTP